MGSSTRRSAPGTNFNVFCWAEAGTANNEQATIPAARLNVFSQARDLRSDIQDSPQSATIGGSPALAMAAWLAGMLERWRVGHQTQIVAICPAFHQECFAWLDL